MIKLTKLSQETFYLNPMHIEQAETSPDLTLTLTNGKKIVIREDMNTFLNALRHYWRGVFLIDEKIKNITQQKD